MDYYLTNAINAPNANTIDDKLVIYYKFNDPEQPQERSIDFDPIAINLTSVRILYRNENLLDNLMILENSIKAKNYIIDKSENIIKKLKEENLTLKNENASLKKNTLSKSMRIIF